MILHSTKGYEVVFSGIISEIKTLNGGKELFYEKYYARIGINTDDNLPLNKPLKFPTLGIIIRCVLQKGEKLYSQIYLDECLYEIVQMLEYNRIDISEGININKTNESKECKICHYWYFKDISFEYEPHLCNGCHSLLQKAVSFNNIAIYYVKGNAYKIHFWYMSKDDAINIMNNSILIDKMGVI